MILAIDLAELEFLKLKKADTTDVKKRIELATKKVVGFKEEVKIQEGNVRKLKQNVRMIVIWAVISILIFSSIGYAICFLMKKDEFMIEDKEFPVVKEGGEDDLYYRFIDNETT